MKLSKPITAERLEAVKQLYFDNWGRLKDEAHESNAELHPEDGYRVVESLNSYLHLYPENLRLTADVFTRWANSVLTATIFMYVLQRQCEAKVRKAIRKFLAGCGGLGVRYRDEHGLGTEDEIASDTWLWALTHIDELRKPGPASLPSRMSEQAKYQAMAWKSKQIDWKEKHPDIGDIELLYLDTETKDGGLSYDLGSQESWRERAKSTSQDDGEGSLAA